MSGTVAVIWKGRRGPRRIICLTEETTETLYRMGEEDRIAGISAFTVRPPEARRDKPVVSQFVKADLEKIAALEPDLVLGFSDLQADICAELIRRGIEVHCFNQRSVAEILDMVRSLGAMIGEPEKGRALALELEGGLEEIATRAARFPWRPRVYFEEWHDPLITGIRWVSELIEIAGGEDVFRELRGARLARERTLSSPDAVLERRPDVYLASWCGRKFRRDYLDKRPGWSEASFMKQGHVFEVDSSAILQPGPGALTDGIQAIHRILVQITATNPSRVGS
ncbi:MAG TPA: cobalamin-binding protein [Candidatus Eisenbacteria bacterium]|nr:cobalamin-binding protein [Candidatus Eisenbacteria bacterium]